MTPEQQARVEIDKLLVAAGWSVQPRANADLTAAQGIAICEFPLKPGHGFADYLLYVDGAAVGVIEAKRAGIPLTGVETQTAKYSVGLPDNLPAPRRPLPKGRPRHTLLRLPTGLFYAQGVKANVLFFDRKPASETRGPNPSGSTISAPTNTSP
jgi:hypothetical protein